MSRKVVVICLMTEQLLESDGTTSYTFTEGNAKELENLGPHIESIRALVVLKNRSTNAGVAVHITGSILGRNYATPAIIQTDVVVNGESIGTDYTASANFCYPHLKALVGIHNTTGAVRETAAVSAFLIVTLKS